MSKPLTNEQRFRRLFDDMHTIEVAVFRSLVMGMPEYIRRGIANNPEGWYNPLISHKAYLVIADKIDEYLGEEPDTVDDSVKLSRINSLLKIGLHTKDKKLILQVYDDVKPLDFEKISSRVTNEYETLLTKCNDFLYS